MKRMALAGAAILSIVGLLVFLFPPTSLAQSGKTRAAVIDFEQKGVQEFKGKQVGEIVAEWIITALVRTGRFEVVERSQLQKLLQEQQLGQSGMISSESAAKVGALLGVKVIITGSVIQLDNLYEVNARLISVEDGSIMKAEKIRGSSLDAIEGMVVSLADSLKRDFPIEGYVVQVIGTRAMIDVGRTHGVETGMVFHVLRKGAPVRHPVTGKMLKGEDIKIGEMAVQRVEMDTAWAEIVQEEQGIKIAAGNLARHSTERTMAAPAPPPPIPGMPAPVAVRPWSGKIQSAKVYIEWTGTGDLLLGDRDGYVTLYLNQGTPDSPQYGNGTRLKAGGQDMRVKGPSAPIVVDWNGDGKPDILVGDGGAYLTLFLNEGSSTTPAFSKGTMIQAGGKNLDAGRGDASPIVIDWNEDGRKDLLIGRGNGEIALFLNEGTNENPVFGKMTILNNGKLDVGSTASPDMADWNGDGKKDLIVGNDSGEIFIFLNIGTNQDPQFNNEGEKLNLKFGPDASPQVIRRGTYSHLAVADRYGEVAFCQNIGTPGSPNFIKKIIKPGKR